MDIKYRKIIAKHPIIHGFARYMMYNSGFLFYWWFSKKRGHLKKIESLKNCHKGDRCFIVGNGASLSVDDLELIIDEDSFGLNEIHRIFHRTNWRPTYYLVMDRYSKSTPEQIRDLEAEMVFLGDYYWRFNKVLRKDAICLHQHQDFAEMKYRFSSDIGKCIFNSPTVSFGALQIAAYMGYSEIFLIGFDHNYHYEFDDNKHICETKTTNSHFFEDECPNEIIANVIGMTKAYEACKNYCDNNGIKIKNASRGGNLEVFERVCLDELF